MNYLIFYERRIRRIIPVLLIVIIVSIPFAWKLLLPSSFVEYSESILSTIFFVSNFFFYSISTDYGADSSLLKPFLHTWSLGVEEQFYIVFPLLAIICIKYLRKYFLTFLVFMFFISLFISEFMQPRDSELNFYLPITRFWELLTGSILAFKEVNYKNRKNNIFLILFPLLGILLISYSIAFLMETHLIQVSYAFTNNWSCSNYKFFFRN